jgi:hypothetical protein
MEKLLVSPVLLTSEYYASTSTESWKDNLSVAIDSRSSASSLTSETCVYLSTSSYDMSSVFLLTLPICISVWFVIEILMY